MIFYDPIYGPTSVEEPVIEALLQSPSLCRLQDVDMAGYARKYWPGCEHTPFGLDVKSVLDERNFPLQERGLPDLCADRIDYAMRSAKYYLKVPVAELRDYLDQLEIVGLK